MWSDQHSRWKYLENDCVLDGRFWCDFLETILDNTLIIDSWEMPAHFTGILILCSSLFEGVTYVLLFRNTTDDGVTVTLMKRIFNGGKNAKLPTISKNFSSNNKTHQNCNCKTCQYIENSTFRPQENGRFRRVKIIQITFEKLRNTAFNSN